MPCGDEFATGPTTVYRLTKSGQTSHVLSLGSDRADLPAAAHAVLATARVVVFEAPPAGAIARPAVRLADQLSGAAWINLVARLTAKGVPVRAIDSLSPAVAYHLLEEADPHRPNLTDLVRGVRARAEQMGIPTETLESPAEQQRLMDLAFDVRQLEDVLISGEPARIHTLTQLSEDHPELYRSLVTDRHRAWGRRADQIHAARGGAVFILNSLHLGGPDGFLSVLTTEGFELFRVN